MTSEHHMTRRHAVKVAGISSGWSGSGALGSSASALSRMLGTLVRSACWGPGPPRGEGQRPVVLGL